MVEFSSGLPKTNPATGGEEDLNPGPPDYKSSALTTNISEVNSLSVRPDKAVDHDHSRD